MLIPGCIDSGKSVLTLSDTVCIFNRTYRETYRNYVYVLQVILQLCKQVQFVEQLVETEELRCVIIALTSLWDQCSSSWRRQASRVLRAVSAAQVPNTVPALQG